MDFMRDSLKKSWLKSLSFLATLKKKDWVFWIDGEVVELPENLGDDGVTTIYGGGLE